MNYSSLVYRLRFENVEEQIVTTDIWDMELPFGDNPYGISFEIIDNGDGTQDVVFTWNEFPGIVDGVTISYSDDNGVTWTDDVGSATSPRTITIPNGDYIFRVNVDRPSLTTTASFNGTNNVILTSATDFFYAGQRIRITGSDLNDGEYTVTASTIYLVQMVLVTGDFSTENNTADVLFEDITSSESFVMGEPEIIELEPSGDPLRLYCSDADEEKFTVAKGMEAQIGFLSGDGYGLNTFREGEDNRFFTHVYMNDDETKTVFKGFLVLEDNEEAFMPDSNEVRLTATDNIGLLRDVPLVDHFGDYPTEVSPIMSFLSWALALTSLKLDIYVAFNIREAEAATLSADTDGSGHFFKWLWLDPKTFEAEVGEAEDALRVIEKILGYEASIFQRSGAWWIVRLDEYEARDGLYLFQFDWQGNFIANHGLIPFDKVIYKGEHDGSEEGDIFFSQEATTVQAQQARKFTRLTFPFELPEEIPCNVTYERGEPTNDPDLQLDGYEAYQLDCWEVKKNFGANEEAPVIKASIQRRFAEYGDEDDRFIMLTIPPSEGPYNYIRSSAIPVTEKDKFKFTFEAAAVDDSAGDGFIYIAHILLYGVDGNVYILRQYDLNQAWDDSLGEIDTQWRQTNAEITLFPATLRFNIWDDADHPNKTEWRSFIMAAAEVPVSGNVRIHLYAANQFSGTYDDFRIKFRNLNFAYHPFIGGYYDKYTGRSHKVTQLATYRQKLDEEVHVSDAARIIFKGALLKEGESGAEFVYDLAQDFYNAAAFPDNVPDAEYRHTYSHIQIFDVWNQFNRAFSVFYGTMQGLTSGDEDDLGLNNAASLLHRWTLADNSDHTNDRYFALLTFEQDFYLCEWTGTFKEVYGSAPKRYEGDDQHEIKYLTNNE